jgi:hypothetical protein
MRNGRAVLPVTVLVMNVREMCVAVAQRSVLMLVGMRLNAISSLRVRMLMMLIVHVGVRMPKRLMRVRACTCCSVICRYTPTGINKAASQNSPATGCA